MPTRLQSTRARKDCHKTTQEMGSRDASNFGHQHMSPAGIRTPAYPSSTIARPRNHSSAIPKATFKPCIQPNLCLPHTPLHFFSCQHCSSHTFSPCSEHSLIHATRQLSFYLHSSTHCFNHSFVYLRHSYLFLKKHIQAHSHFSSHQSTHCNPGLSSI